MKMKSKQRLSILLAVTMIFGLFTTMPLSATSADGITMVFTIDGNVYTINGVATLMDVSPVVVEDRTMLPVRFVAEPLGAAVDWDGNTEKVTVRLMDTKLELWIGQSNALVNGVTTPIDPDNTNVKPLLLSDRTMLPLRFVTENLGCEVAWDGDTQQVTITKGTGGAAATNDEEDGNGATADEEESIIEDGEDPDGLGESGATDDEPGPDKLPGYRSIGAVEMQPIGNKHAYFDITKLKVVTPESMSGIKTLMEIGRGYDVFDRYASGISLRNAVLDADKLVAAGQIHHDYLDLGDFFEISGESLAEYSKAITTRAKVSGGYMSFGASVEASFSSSYRSKNTSYYHTINYLVMAESAFIKGSCNYKNYLLPDVKEIIDKGVYDGKNWTPNEIFEKYGGHVLVDGIFGGRLEYSVTANSEFCESYSNFQANVKASYNAGFASLGGELDHTKTENELNYNSHSSTTVMTYGGSAQDGMSLTNSSGTALQTWRDSIPNAPRLIEFGQTGALIPIWELCSNPARANELKNAFDQYANGKQIQLPEPRKYVTNIKFVWHKNSAEAALNQISANYPGYIATQVDLNRNAEGDFIFLIYKLDTNVDLAWRDLFAEFRIPSTPGDGSETTQSQTHNGKVANYYRWPQDLKQRTKGDTWVYLWGSKDVDLNPITQIEVVTEIGPNDANQGWKYVQWQNTYTPADTNRGAAKHRGETYIRYR